MNDRRQHDATRPARRPTRRFAIMLCLVGLAACSGTSPSGTGATGSIEPPERAEKKAVADAGLKAPVKVALILPLTSGPQMSAIANAMRQAAELALFERDSPHLQLIVKDDKGTPDGAVAAAEDAVKQGAELVLGPLFSRSVAAVAPVTRKANIPVIAFSNDRGVTGNGVYLLSFLPSQDVPRGLAYALAQGRKRFVALVPDDAYGKATEQLFRAAVGDGGGTVVRVERYPHDTDGMIEPAKRIGAAMREADGTGSPIDALFLPGGQETLPMVAPMIPYLRIDTRKVKLIGTGGWDYPHAGNEKALVGGWFAAPEAAGWTDFVARFSKSTGSAPPRLASLAYDAVTLAALLSAGPSGARYTGANLTRTAGFTGVDGNYRLLADGTSERMLAIYEMKPSGPEVIEPASRTFGPAPSGPMAPTASVLPATPSALPRLPATEARSSATEESTRPLGN